MEVNVFVRVYLYLCYCRLCFLLILFYNEDLPNLKKWSSNSDLHTFLRPVLIIFLHHMSTTSQPITSDNSLNYYKFSQFFTSCCLPTPLTLVCVGGGREYNHPAFGPPASVSLHLASSSLTPAGTVYKSRGDSVVRMWVKLKIWCVWVLQRGHSDDGCDLASTLCKYDLRKGDLFVLNWARVRRVRRGSISPELLMCGGGVRSIILLPLVDRCLETIDACIFRMFVCMSVVVTV